MSTTTRSSAQILAVNTDNLTWTSLFGGTWGAAANWQDTNSGTVATAPPSATNAVTIDGGNGGNFTNIVGSGSAAQLAVTGDVLLWGALGITAGVSVAAAGELDLDGGASLTGAALTLAAGAGMQAADGSAVVVAGSANVAGGLMLAVSGGSMQFGSLIAGSGTQTMTSGGLNTATVAVDAGASIEIGTTGNVTPGAITIDAGQTATVSGTLDGNLAVNGNLAVQAGGTLAIDTADPFGNAQTIAGTGTLLIGEGSRVVLGVADSAAIQFAAPNGTLIANVLPTGTITGFTSGDTIALTSLATGLRYTQTSSTLATLTLSKGGATVGTLALEGNYAGKLFHIQMDAQGTAFITEQTIGAPPVQPSVIAGTAGSDLLIATANNQTLTGLGGNDVLSAATFTGIDFKDTSANLNGSTITAFGATDTIDLTDMNAGYAVVSLTGATISATGMAVPATISVTDGTHAATVTLATAGSLPPGAWSASADGSGGSVVRYSAINTDTFAFAPVAGDSIAIAANWQDTTAGTTAALVPGPGNAIGLTGGASFTDIAGSAAAASVIASGDILLLGTIVAGAAIPGISGALTQAGTLALDSGASLRLAGTATVNGLLTVGGASHLSAASLAASGSDIAIVAAAAGSAVQFGSVGAGTTLAVAADATSSIEFGVNGLAKAGAVTIDGGLTANLAGTIAGNVVVNGTLLASGRSLAITPFGQGTTASITGSGMLEIDAGATLAIAGADSGAILFSPSGGTLVLDAGPPSGTISGFGRGDAIAAGQAITALAYSPGGAGTGTLTLFDAGTTVGTMTFAGAYTAQQFQLLVAGNGQSGTIVYAPAPNAAPGNQINSGTDAYSWIASSGGVWGNAANWIDTTTASPATGGPGAGDAVVIQDNTGASTQQIVSGSGAAASLQVYGSSNTIFTGTLAVGGEFYAAAAAGSDVMLTAGAHIWAASLYDYTAMTISGASTLTGTGAGGGSTEIVGSMSVVGGSSVRAASVDIGGGTLGVDATSVFEAGSAGGTATGAVTIDAGQTATIEENGTIAAALIVNGLLIADNATIEGFAGTAGSIGGSGTIAIGAATGPGRLTLSSADSAALSFSQPGNVLELRGALPTGAIGGFAASDAILIDRTVTGVTFNPSNSLQGTLTLSDGAAKVGTLTLLGNYAGSQFQVSTAAATGFGTISVLPAATGGSLSTATLAIGHDTTMSGQIVISALLAISGGSVMTLTGARLNAPNANITGTLDAGNGSGAVIAYTATLSGGTLLALDGSTIQLGALVGTGNGNVIAVDANSIVKVAAPTAVAGALTQGPNSTLIMSGSIYGNVVANGTLAVPAGGWLFIDLTGQSANDPYETTSTIGGSGTLTIAEGATLGLGATDTASIQFNGPNATLALAAIPSGHIAGFYAGDKIVLDRTVTGIGFTQLTPTAAALTLNDGGTMIGTLNLTGNFSGTQFHLDPAANGNSATITLQTLGLGADQPTLIQGTMATEALTATANGQTITGSGGNDILNGAGFSGVDFKDTTARTNFYTIQNFTPSDVLDLVDMNTSTAWVRYANQLVSVSDGVHSANIALSFAAAPASGSFHLSSDGAGGSVLAWA
jgi:hypothetical protein